MTDSTPATPALSKGRRITEDVVVAIRAKMDEEQEKARQQAPRKEDYDKELYVWMVSQAREREYAMIRQRAADAKVDSERGLGADSAKQVLITFKGVAVDTTVASKP